MPLFVIDTGSNYDRPVQKGQWAISDIPNGGSKIVNEWLKERTKALVKELKYARLEGAGKINVKPLADDFDIDVDVSVRIRPASKKKHPVTNEKEPIRRRAQR